MRRRIVRYDLALGSTEVPLEESSNILSVAIVRERVRLWVAEDIPDLDRAPVDSRTYRFAVLHDGSEIPDGARFLGTCAGGSVGDLHVFQLV